MNYSDTSKVVRELSRHVETLGALGAAFAQLAGEAKVNGAIEPKLDAVREALHLDALDGISSDEMRFLHARARASLRNALNLVESPGTPARWTVDDPVILQTQGKASRMVTRLVASFSERTESFSERLGQPARFLDVGSGVGWISITMAERWPQLTVDGIDIHEPALRLAEKNRVTSIAAERIRFCRRDVVDLEEVDSYASAFLPLIFMPEDVVSSALPALRRAIEPGGWLFVAGYRAPDTPLGKALTDLRTTLSGGRLWTDDETVHILAEHGFEIVEDVGAGTPITLFAGRKC